MAKYLSLSIERSNAHLAHLLLGSGRNHAMGPDFWGELPLAVAELEAEPELRVLIVRGSGEHFSYGLDLAAMGAQIGPILAAGAAGRAAIVHLAEQMHSGFAALAASRLPVIAAIDGWCIGAGIEMIAACDLRIASRRARFALREVKVGIVPDLGGIQRLPHLIGEGWTRRLALTGEDFDTDAALRMGLVNEVHADTEALNLAATNLAEAIASNPPLVVAGIKQVMNRRIAQQVARGNHDAASLNAMTMQSEDFAEAMRAFIERRTPQFHGR